MNILALDYGRKRIGVALVSTGINVVLPLGVIKEQGTMNKEQVIVDLVNREKCDLLVIGLPLGLDGSENENTKNIRNFATQLQQKVGLPIVFFDERFSSRQADRVGPGVSRDEKAAMVILEGYLQSISKNKK